MADKHIPIASYFEKADCRFPTGKNSTWNLHHRPSLLHPTNCNRILIYPGSFNPPHHSHREMLQLVLENCADLNIVGAVIVPTDNKSIEYKNKNSDNICLNLDERCSLWTDCLPNDRCMVYRSPDARSIQAGFDSWILKLQDSILSDGYWLKFVTLYGMDCAHGEHYQPWQGEEVIFSDQGRGPSYSYDKDGSLKCMDECLPWEKHQVDMEYLRERALQGAELAHRQSPDGDHDHKGKWPESCRKAVDVQAQKILGVDLAQGQAMRVCSPNDEDRHHCMIYFVPKSGWQTTTSSTNIQKLIRKYREDKDDDGLRSQLERLALNHESLVKMIKKRGAA